MLLTEHIYIYTIFKTTIDSDNFSESQNPTNIADPCDPKVDFFNSLAGIFQHVSVQDIRYLTYSQLIGDDYTFSDIDQGYTQAQPHKFQANRLLVDTFS